MTKKFKIWVILTISSALIVLLGAIVITETKNQPVNSWWQALLAAFTVIAGGLGMLTAKKWSWLKSDVGKGVFFLSLGLLLWGIAQIFWTYALFSKDSSAAPLSSSLNILSYFYFLILPIIVYGMIKLSQATGAKYLFKKPAVKLVIAFCSIALIAATSFILILMAGGMSYFSDNTIWRIIYYLGFPVMDAIALVIAVSIVGLSWKELGGKFRLPVIALALGFILLYIADFAFSYYDGQSQYYNGHWSLVLFVLPITIFSIALCSLDPTQKTNIKK